VFARLVGNFSKVSGFVSPDNSPYFELAMIPQLATQVAEHATQFLRHMKGARLSPIVSLMAESIRLLKGRPLEGKARTQLTHGDLHYKNVIWDSASHQYTIIDLNSLGPGITATEIVVLMSNILSDSPLLNEVKISQVLENYEKNFQLMTSEKNCIPHLMIIRKLNEIEYLLENRDSIGENRFVRNIHFAQQQLTYIIQQFDQIDSIDHLLV